MKGVISIIAAHNYLSSIIMNTNPIFENNQSSTNPPPPSCTPTMPTAPGVYIGDAPTTNTSGSVGNQADIEEALVPTPSTNVTRKFLTTICLSVYLLSIYLLLLNPNVAFGFAIL